MTQKKLEKTIVKIRKAISDLTELTNKMAEAVIKADTEEKTKVPPARDITKEQPEKRKGRPKGSKNKTTEASPTVGKAVELPVGAAASTAATTETPAVEKTVAPPKTSWTAPECSGGAIPAYKPPQDAPKRRGRPPRAKTV